MYYSLDGAHTIFPLKSKEQRLGEGGKGDNHTGFFIYISGKTLAD